MMIQSSPSVTVDTLQKAEAGSTAKAESAAEKIVMRGPEQDTISSLTAKGKDVEAKGDTAGAEQAYRGAVTSVAKPINDLAWLYLQSGRAKDSLGLATPPRNFGPMSRATSTRSTSRRAAQHAPDTPRIP